MTHFNKYRFATYRNRLLRTFAVITFLGLASIIMLPEVSRGQCPPNDPPALGGDPWIGDWGGPYTETITLRGTGCTLTVTYCLREGMDPAFGPFYAKYIESVTPTPGSDCSGMTPSQIIKLVYQQEETIGVDGTVGPCTNGTTFTVTMAAPCWIDIPFQWTDGQWYNAYYTCGNPSDYCRMDCQVCENSDGSYTTTCTWSGSSDPACTPLPSPELWQPNTCYDVEPCNGEPH